MIAMSSRKSLTFWLHGLLLTAPIALLTPAIARLETPLPDGIYRAARGYNHASERCLYRVEIAEVRISSGVIAFESGDASWTGMINESTGVIRIEAPGITPRPTSALHIRGHYTKAQLFSAICGTGYFRIFR